MVVSCWHGDPPTTNNMALGAWRLGFGKCVRNTKLWHRRRTRNDHYGGLLVLNAELLPGMLLDGRGSTVAAGRNLGGGRRGRRLEAGPRRTFTVHCV